MTGLLASVNTLREAKTALDVGADIIDLKQPRKGALGALSTEQVYSITKEIAGRKPVSATIGDLPMYPDLIYKAVSNMSKTGVNYIKIGLFPDGDLLSTLLKLKPLCHQDTALIAVFFADNNPDLKLIPRIAETGFTGVMLDTMDKRKGSLTDLMALETIESFVASADKHQLITGLAGSLLASDIPVLAELQPDYLGFRSALCVNRCRTAELDEASIIALKNQLHNSLSTLPI